MVLSFVVKIVAKVSQNATRRAQKIQFISTFFNKFGKKIKHPCYKN